MKNIKLALNIVTQVLKEFETDIEVQLQENTILQQQYEDTISQLRKIRIQLLEESN